MPLTSQEAAETLRDIDQTTGRSAKAYGYSIGSPHLILWGVIWSIGYGLVALRLDPTRFPASTYAFPVLAALGIAGSLLIGWRMRAGSATHYDWRHLATVAAVAVFVTAIFAIIPLKGEQIGAFFPLLAALFYAIVGIWTKGTRMIVLGACIAAVALFAFFAQPAYFAIWMAIAGGGGLIVGGFWLRNV